MLQHVLPQHSCMPQQHLQLELTRMLAQQSRDSRTFKVQLQLETEALMLVSHLCKRISSVDTAALLHLLDQNAAYAQLQLMHSGLRRPSRVPSTTASSTSTSDPLCISTHVPPAGPSSLPHLRPCGPQCHILCNSCPAVPTASNAYEFHASCAAAHTVCGTGSYDGCNQGLDPCAIVLSALVLHLLSLHYKDSHGLYAHEWHALATCKLQCTVL